VSASANWRQAVDAARLSLRLVSEATADLLGWAAHGLRSGSSMLVAWLVSLAVAGRRRLRHGSTAAGRHVRAGSAATREGLRAGSAAAGQGLRGAGRGVRGAGAGIAGAAGGLASRIDALADRGGAARGGNGSEAPPAEALAATQEFDGARNGHSDGAGRGRLVLDPANPVEAWWLPSGMADPVSIADPVSMADPVEEAPRAPAGRQARRAHGRAANGRDPVVAGLATGLGRASGPFRRMGAWLAPVVTAMAAPPNHRRRGWLAFARPVVVALALTLVVATATAVPAGMLVADSVKGAGAGLPELEELRQLRQPERTQVYDRQGRVIEVLKDEQDRIVVPLSQISPILQQAVIAAEDARFYEHKGVDDRGIVRAAVTNLLSGQVSQGGSTITQQLVRNSYPDLKDISIVRKIKEAALAAQLEGKLSKQEILHRYLNRVYFGAGYYGVEAASKGYFHKHASEVSLAQAATLAGVIREPVSSEPRQHKERAKLLRDSVLQRMTQLGMIPAAQAAKAQKQPLKIEKPGTVGGRYPWFIDGLKRQLQEDERLGRTREARTQRLFEGGLRIHTTLDRDMQRAAEQAVARWLPPSGPDIALVAIDPRDGGVRAVVGGRNFKLGAYNAALQGVVVQGLRAGRRPGGRHLARLGLGVERLRPAGLRLPLVARQLRRRRVGQDLGPGGDQALGQRRVREADGEALSRQGGRDGRAAGHPQDPRRQAGAGDGPRLGRGAPDRHGQRLRHPGRPGRVPQADLLREGRPPQRPVGDRPAVTARAASLGRAGLAGHRYPQGRRHRRHRSRGQHRPPHGRQDRHHPELPRRLVRRLHPTAGGGGLDGSHQEPRTDVQRAGDPSDRRQLPGPGLARLHGRGHGQPAGP